VSKLGREFGRERKRGRMRHEFRAHLLSVSKRHRGTDRKVISLKTEETKMKLVRTNVDWTLWGLAVVVDVEARQFSLLIGPVMVIFFGKDGKNS